MKNRAIMAIFLRISRLRLRASGLSGALVARSSTSPAGMVLAASCAIPDPRVYERVDDVDHHADNDPDRRTNDRHGHDHVVVAGVDRLKGQTPDAGNARERL